MIYLDNAATTPVKKEVFEAMAPYFCERFGNASSIYAIGRESKKALEDARQTISGILGCTPREIYFTGSGSEADNWAIKGAASAMRGRGKHIITTQTEHHAVLHTCQYLEKNGCRVTYLPVDEFGMVSPQAVKEAICDDTILISVIYANNEIGTINPIHEIAAVAKEAGVLFHTDAVQAVGNLPMNLSELGVDMLSASSHKFGGPKGVGFLYVRKGIKIDNFLHGGAQEANRRASTENIAGIVGLAKALELAAGGMEARIKEETALRDKLISGIKASIPYVRLNGHPEKRLPGNVNVSFQYIEGESLLLMLDMAGIAASSGSACTSGSLDPSHVLLAIGLPHEIAHGSLRLTIGDGNTEAEIETVLEKLPPIVQRLRDMSPLYEEVAKKQAT